ncbi:MAG: hypothetical protein ABIP55_06380 [Tepidisphaeraceae bacterium]
MRRLFEDGVDVEVKSAAIELTIGGAVKVVGGDLQVVLHRDGLGVANPLVDHVHGEVLGQFGLAGRAHVLEGALPRRQPRPLDDAVHLRAQVGASLSTARANVNRPFCCLIIGVFEERADLREHGQDADDRPALPRPLGIADADAVLVPQDVPPGEVLQFRRDAHAAVARHPEDDLPFQVRAGIEDSLRPLRPDEFHPFRVRPDRGREVLERVDGDRLARHRLAEGLLHLLHDRVHRVAALE